MCGVWTDRDSKSILQRSDSEPPGTIINLIIKHLLPTAPALSLSSGPPGTPSRRGREEKSKREGGTQEEPEGGVGERRAANPKGS